MIKQAAWLGLVFSCTVFAQTLRTVALDHSNLTAGQTANVLVNLSAETVNLETVLNISSSSPNLTVPPSILIPRGRRNATFSVTAADPLPGNEIVSLKITQGSNAQTVFVALNKPYTPTYPITLTFQQGVNGYTGCVDRLLSADAGPLTAVKDPTYVPLRGAGDQKNWYLLRCDLSAIPAGSTINSATLTFGSSAYSPSPLDAQVITDPDTLGSGMAPGWGDTGPAAAQTRGGGTPALRNQTGSVKWQNADPNDNHSHIAGILAPSEGAVSYQTSGLHKHTVTAAVQAWANGAPNEGWALSAEFDSANVELFGLQDPNPRNRPLLSVTFTPAGSDTTPPATITDLTLVSCTSQAPINCTLQWTAPGDNGMDGTAAGYQVLYGNGAITDATIATATVASVTISPQPAGTRQTVTIANLGQGFAYSFAVRTRDAAFNWSPPSNVVTASTPNPRGVSSTHPRILLTAGVADTWTPGLDRLAAIRQRIQSGQAQTDFKALQALVNGYKAGNLFNPTDNAALLLPVSFAFMYQMLLPTDAAAANSYADWVIDHFLLVAPWTDGGYDDTVAFQAEASALIYDWCYDRIVSRGLQPQAIASLKAAYALLANDAGFWQQNIRESDFHNYSVEIENAYIALGLALYGDDASASAMLDRGWGMFAEGYPFQPTSFGDTFTFQLKSSIDTLTGGALNWEGPVYWRASAPEILRGIEAYDTATGRSGAVWTNQFSNLVNAGYYKIYMLQPNGTNPGLGDATQDTPTAGRDNFGMVILLDRFKDSYIKQFVDTAVNSAWDAGSGGWAGLVWKLIFYDYTNQVPDKPYSDLPTSREFGRDVVMRTGWGPNDSYVTFSAGYTGVFHNHLDQGGFTIFKQKPLIGNGGPYSVSGGPYYYGYFKRSIASDVPLIYDAGECWRDSTAACSFSNDGGQRWPFRRFNPPFSTNPYGINRLWSGTLFSDSGTGSSYSEQFLASTKTSALNRASGAVDYISADLTKAYTNAFSNANGDPKNTNTNARVSLVTRDFVFAKPNYVVVFDRVASTKPEFPKSLPLHTYSPPSVAGVAAPPGINTNSAGTVQSDNGAGRIFIQPLLPQTAQIRVVGGNTCRPVEIVNCTAANPSVCTTAEPHHLAEGEMLGIQGGGNTNYWAIADFGIGTDNPNVGALTAHVIDDTTFTPVRGNAAPVDGTIAGLGAFPQGMQITYHAACGYEGYVDNYLGQPANLWWPANNAPAFAAGSPRWRTEIQAQPGSLTDYFLNVLYPTTTASATMPQTSLIESANYYGALIRDASTPQVVLFSKSQTRQRGVSYTASYDGVAQHVITGLAAGTYTVSLNGSSLSGYTATAVGPDGLLTFNAAAGGTFTIATAAQGQ